jgi:dienelactone hydrolase
VRFRFRLTNLLALVICAGLTGFFPATGVGQVARVEIHPIKTKMLTDQQFLTGAKEGPDVIIAGELRLPRLGDERLAAVILMHGSGGISRYVTDWVPVLNALGIATFVVDSFSGRGVTSVTTDQARLGRLVQVFDSYRALEVMANHPRIDPARIAGMGFSRGGQSVLYASLKRFQKMHGPGEAAFSAYIPFYATCNTAYIDDEDAADAPIRMFHGTADDYVPIAPCRAYVERLRKSGKNVTLTEYAGAHHVFDGVQFKTPQWLPQNQTTRRCTLEEVAGGTIINSETKQPFTFADPCVERGATVAYHEEAHKASIQAVSDFLRATFKLN